MQYSIASAITTVLFASTFTSAVVIPRASDINISFKTGDGDASRQATVATGSLQATDSSGSAFLPAVNAQVVDQGFTCQAFSDAKGATKLGGTFDSTTTASFTDASDGGVDSNASDAVTVGAICCAPSKDFNSVCNKSGSAGSGKSSNDDLFNVRIQINGAEDELATQGNILSDNKPHALTAPLEGEDAVQVSIVHTHKAVSCQAFADLKGKKPLGAPFQANKDVSFTKPVDIESVSCKVL